MADINVDVNLPSTITVDVTSPTQALAANISIPGPQGPAGIQGPSGAVGPSGAIGPSGAVGPSGAIGPSGAVGPSGATGPNGSITGINNIVYTTGNQTISGNKTFAEKTMFGDSAQGDFLVISGNNFTVYGSGNFTSGLFVNGNAVLTGVNLSSYATTTNLASTGSNLENKITSLSGTLTGNYLTTNIASSTYATINNLNSTGSTLNSTINSLSGDSVLTYNNQTINGQKTFTENLVVQKSGFFWSGIKIGLNSIIITEESIKISGDPVIVRSTFTGYTGDVVNTYATITNVASTGATLNNNINSLSGTLTSNYATITNLASTGSTLVNTISSLSGTLTSNYATINNLNSTGSTLETNIASTGNTLNLSINSLSGTLTSTYATITNLASTGSTLNNSINSLSGTLTSNYATITNLASTGSTLVTNLASTGSTLNTRINNLSGYINSTSSNIVFTTGNQTISGIKTFVQDATFGDSAQGDFLVISGNNFTVYGSGNFTSGLFVNSSPVLTGSSTLYATSVNLISTGSTLDNKINSLSGYINSSSSNIVFTTGNQAISGIKIFNSGLGARYISGVSGSRLDIIAWSGNENISDLNRSINIQAGHGPTTIPLLGGSVNINAGNSPNFNTAGSINLTAGTGTNNFAGGINIYAGVTPKYAGTNSIYGNININSNGSLLPDSKTINIYRSGSIGGYPLAQVGVLIDNNKVDVNNGMLLQVSGVNVTPALYATITNLASTGSTLDTKINNLSGVSVLTFGNQTINGLKTFTSGIDLNNSKLINATPDLLNVSANFNITGTQNSRVILANSPTIITGSIVSGNPIGFNTSIIQISSGQVLITGIGSNVIVSSYNNQFRTAAQYATISILHTGNDGYIMYGNTST